MLDVVIDDTTVLLCRVDGEIHAMAGICSHGNVPLSFGRLKGATVTCPLHGAQFDVRTGRCLTGPSKLDLPTYDVSESDGTLLIATDA